MACQPARNRLLDFIRELRDQPSEAFSMLPASLPNGETNSHPIACMIYDPARHRALVRVVSPSLQATNDCWRLL